ncbi:hypothetical protein [Nocardia wallacei]|uniref:hypothetical protein n=1 Tax=Nocardia wallacei TaxID=480035 RepID=UPI0024558756|nr:hypothetical protein [Nocardia wallacei]
MTAPLVFIDTETTGLHADRRPWDIGMIRRDPDGTQREITIYISDVDLSAAELIGLRIGHFYDRHPMYSGGPGVYDPERINPECFDPWSSGRNLTANEFLLGEWQAAETVEKWTRGAHIVGMVPNFDTETLAAMLRRHERCPAWHYHLIDVEALAIGWLKAVEAENISKLIELAPGNAYQRSVSEPPWKSDDISRAIGVEPPGDDDRHTAIGDARWAMRLYDKIAGGPTA